MFSLQQVWKCLAVASALCAAQAASAQDFVNGTSFEVATGTRTQIVRFGVQHDFNRSWFESNGRHLSGYWDLTVADWRANYWHSIPGNSQNLVDIGITPVWRWENVSKKGLYVEGAVGAHLLSHTYDNDGRRLSTAFEFGDHIGVGYVFDNGFDAALKIQHYSNGGIKHPNSGVNTVVAKLGYHF